MGKTENEEKVRTFLHSLTKSKIIDYKEFGAGYGNAILFDLIGDCWCGGAILEDDYLENLQKEYDVCKFNENRNPTKSAQ